MAESDVIVENGEVAPFDVETQETGIVPVNNEEIQEVTAAQAAVVLGTTMLVGYGIGKLGELVFDKWVGPACGKLADKWKERKAKKDAKKLKDQVEVSVITPDDKSDSEKEEDKYEKVSNKIRENNYKK